MGIKYDFSAIRREVSRVRQDVYDAMEEAGRNAVENARERGNYKDRTGKLRASNRYENDGERLRIYNDAEYAGYVEARGYDVISSAALEALGELEQKLKK